MSNSSSPSAKNKLFFSYATVSAMCDASYSAVKEFLDEFYAVGPPEVLYKYDNIYQKLSAEAAKLLNCQASEITYIKNTTEGIIIASETIPLKKGDQVLVMANEYPANILPWLKKRKDGVDVQLIGGRDNHNAFQTLIKTINPKTRVISISSTQSYDGYMVNLDKLSKLCRQKNIYLVIDAVQTVGTRKIDLTKTPVDFLVCGGQKYLRAGPGSGFMYVNQRVMKDLKDFKVGIRSMQSFDETSYNLKPSAERFQDGTQNLSGIVAITAAIQHINEIGIEEIEKRNLNLLAQIKACLAKYGIPFINHGNAQGNILALQVSQPQELFEYLKDRNIYIKPIKDVARISFIHETKIEEVEKAADLISKWLNQINNKHLSKSNRTARALETV